VAGIISQSVRFPGAMGNFCLVPSPQKKLDLIQFSFKKKLSQISRLVKKGASICMGTIKEKEKRFRFGCGPMLMMAISI
jgi:hypothetical protein